MREPLAHPGLEVARAVELVVQPACAECLGVGAELIVCRVPPERRERRFRGEHARFDRGVAALDARSVEESGVVPDQAAAGKDELRQRLQPACRDRARAVGDALAAFEKGADRGMRLVALEFLVRAQVRIAVAEPNDETDRDLVVLEVVEERPAVGVAGERPARGVDDQPLLVLLGPDFPQLLQPDAVDLRVGARAQAVAVLKLPAEMAAAAFREKRIAGVQRHARLMIGGRSCRRARCPCRRWRRRAPRRLRGTALPRPRSPGKSPRPSPSACLASQRHTLPRLTTYMPWFLKHAGSMKSGTLQDPPSVRNRKRSSLTGALSGASSRCQSGMSSFSERGSITAPERMCAPTSEPFSSTQTLTSVLVLRRELLQADRRGESRRARRRRRRRHTPSPRAAPFLTSISVSQHYKARSSPMRPRSVTVNASLIQRH